MDNNISDDGSLACLNIPEDKSNKHFNCPEITQQKLKIGILLCQRSWNYLFM